jgi:hypothetical protein
MGTRGRKSAASQSVVITASFGRRPEPPDELTDEQAAIWRATTESEPTEFFGSAATQALLADYCRHRASADAVSKMIDAFDMGLLTSAAGAKQYHGLLKIRDHECRAAGEKARALRMTNQSKYTPKSAATASKRQSAKITQPWDFDGSED